MDIEKKSKTHTRLEKRFLIGRSRRKHANFQESHCFQATYSIKKTEKQTINPTYLVSIGCGRLAEGKGHETDWRDQRKSSSDENSVRVQYRMRTYFFYKRLGHDTAYQEWDRTLSTNVRKHRTRCFLRWGTGTEYFTDFEDKRFNLDFDM